jgi:uncharacterized protein (DUF433 family)
MQAVAIIDRGRGPEIAGTRITVLDLAEYFEAGWHHTAIASLVRLSSEEVKAAQRYYEEHKDVLLPQLRRFQEMIARGNPPEVEARLAKTRERLQAMLQAKRAALTEESNGRPRS